MRSGEERHLVVLNLGTIPYRAAWDLQTRLHTALVARKRGAAHDLLDRIDPGAHFLLLCEHPPVYTLGKSGHMHHLLRGEEDLAGEGFEFYKINRGGDITYHGPGQLVGYPILDLESFFTDVHRYIRHIEQVMIDHLADYGIEGRRAPSHTGVWTLHDQHPHHRKIAAIGVHLSRWVSMHGFAYNVQPDLGHFGNIIPCGIAEPDHSVCSLQSITGRHFDMSTICQEITAHFSRVFEVPVTHSSISQFS